MSDQLTITHPSASTLYAILRQADSANAFNLSTGELEPWDQANRADYAISLADMSGDLYQAAFPSSAPSGAWRVHVYRQLGVTVSSSDPVVAFAAAAWTGTDLVDVDLSELSPQALCGLGELKRHIRLDTDLHDALLIDCINGASGWVGLVTGRSFALQSHVETRRVGRTDVVLSLEHHPVVGPVDVFVPVAVGIKVRRTGPALRASVNATQDGLCLRWTGTDGQRHETTLSYTTYPTLAALADAVSLQEGWAGKPAGEGESCLLQNTGYAEVHTREVTLEGWRQIDPSWELQAQQGLLRLQQGQPCTGRVRLAYSAGYDPIPADVRQLALRLASRVYHFGKHDPTLARESLGEYMASLNTTGALPAEEQAALSRLTNLALA